MLGRELENLHAAELTLTVLSGHVEDQVAVAHPSAGAAREADVGELAEGLLLARRLLQRRREQLAEEQLEADEQDSREQRDSRDARNRHAGGAHHRQLAAARQRDRKSTRLNSSHRTISYAVFCLKKKKT